jgi:xanthine dehydrogenase accessory factor
VADRFAVAAFHALQQHPGVLVHVERTEGSAPRETGAWMLVMNDAVVNTIGGGRLEFDAIAHARRLLRGQAVPSTQRYALGPSLGQCCGGVVYLRHQLIEAGDATKNIAACAIFTPAGSQNDALYGPVALFGGGHVGRAIAQVLGRLPYRITWVDSRDEIFPADVQDNITCEHSDPVQAAVKDLQSASKVLIMSFSHAEDLEVVAACLTRLREKNDLPYVGLIGSKTKWAAFKRRLQERGYRDDELAHITCPIGIEGIEGKEPEVIAVSVAAQLLQIAR